MMSGKTTLLCLCLLLVTLKTLVSARAETYRCISGLPCFPDTATLARFNQSLSGRLVVQRPIQASCYASDTLSDLSKCLEYTTNQLNLSFLADHSSSYEIPSWETCGPDNSCQFLQGSVPIIGKCEQGNVPLYSVHATSLDDVQKFVKFANNHNLRVSLKNTGHDYKGRSAGKNSFSLWTHNMKSMSFDENFVAEGCSPNKKYPSVTIAAGAQWGEVYAFAHEHGYMVVGGDANSVGAAGGWPLGGGHSYLSPTYGLGVDNILEVTMVLANGTAIKANQCTNSDIFWAIRGSGGGTMGIVTELTYKAYPEVPLATVSFVGTGLSLTQTSLESLVTQVAKIAPRLGNLGFGGQFEVVNGALLIQGIMVNASVDQIKEAFSPLQNYPLQVDTKTISLFVNLFRFGTSSSWYEYAKENFGGFQGGGIGLITASRLITADAFAKPEELANALQNAANQGAIGGGFGFLQVGGNTTGARGQESYYNDPATTSVTPAWNSAIWHVIFGQISTGNVPNSTVSASSYKGAHQAAEYMAKYLPDSGAYQNEADVFESDHIQAYWGKENYARLLTIKEKIDPANMFNVWMGVGWTEQGGRSLDSGAPDGGPYSCYPTLSEDN